MVDWWSIAQTHRTITRGLDEVLEKVIPKVIPKSDSVPRY